MEKQHTYLLSLKWEGNLGKGTSHYLSYKRSHAICIKGKPDIAGSSDPAFLGSILPKQPRKIAVGFSVGLPYAAIPSFMCY